MNKLQAQSSTKQYRVQVTSVGLIRPLSEALPPVSSKAMAQAWAELATYAGTQGLSALNKSIFSRMELPRLRGKACDVVLELTMTEPQMTGETIGLKTKVLLDHLAQLAWSELDERSVLEFHDWVVVDCSQVHAKMSETVEEAMAA